MMSLDELGQVVSRWSSDLPSDLLRDLPRDWPGLIRSVEPRWIAVFLVPAFVAAVSRILSATLACLLLAGVMLSLATPADPVHNLPQIVAAWIAAILVAITAWSLRRYRSRARREAGRMAALATDLEDTRAALEREVFARVLRQAPDGSRRREPAASGEMGRAISEP